MQLAREKCAGLQSALVSLFSQGGEREPAICLFCCPVDMCRLLTILGMNMRWLLAFRPAYV